MASIDAVIAQARRPGAFAERRRFTLARAQAISKLREFALADPAAYILELIQSAIANGAVWIEVRRDDATMTLAYIGGGIPEAALGRLFDFLFASKDRADLGYLRELALGVNALLAYRPKKIIIESGDGTREGTTRMELHAGEDRLDVGRPDHALNGTFVRAEGLRGPAGAARRERGLIETRCLAAPVPILFDGEAVFGHSKQRVPGLIGFRGAVPFDEGDLYGAIGLSADVGGRAEFSLLTRGVLIESVAHELIRGQPLGGVICFEGLRKSADHAKIVRDDRYEEMWLRVRPYARAVLGAKVDVGAGALQATAFDGAAIGSVSELRAWLRRAQRVVLVPPTLTKTGAEAADARAIAGALAAELLRVEPGQAGALRILGGSEVTIYTPSFAPGSPDRAFYEHGPVGPPARPWLVQPIDVPALTVGQLRPALASDEQPLRADQVVHALGVATEVKLRVYSPASAEDNERVEVQLRSGDRLLARVALPAVHPGHVLVVELPAVSPSQLRSSTRADAGLELAGALAAACLRQAAPALAEAADRVLAGLVDVTAELAPLERHRVLTALARTVRPRLRRCVDADGRVRPAIGFSAVEPGPPGVDLLGLPALRSATGRPLSARDLAALMSTHTEGWVLAAHEAATPDAADLDHVLRLAPADERLLLALVGESAYLRVDGTCPGGHGPAAMDAAGRVHEAAAVEAALRAGRRIVAHYCHPLPRQSAGAEPAAEVPDELWLPPWSYLRLAGLGALVPAFDFHLSDAEAREHGDEAAFVASAAVEGPEVEGTIGVPLAVTELPGVLVVDEQLRHVHRFTDLAADFGVVGMLRQRAAGWSEGRAAAVVAAIQQATAAVYEDLLARVPSLDPRGRAFARGAAAILAYAGRRLAFVADAAGSVRVPAVQGVADLVLALPLFPGRRGLPVAAWQLVRRFAAAGGATAAALAEVDLEATPPVLRAWVERTLCPSRVAREFVAPPAGRGEAPSLEIDVDGRVWATAIRAAPLDEISLATTLEYWLHQLRPDAPGEPWLYPPRPDAPNGRTWDHRGRVFIEIEASEPRDFATVTGDASQWSITLERGHWLVRWALDAAGREREPLAWLLLACYARINEDFDAVTNTHESQFQRAVADALEGGRLAIVAPRMQ